MHSHISGCMKPVHAFACTLVLAERVTCAVISFKFNSFELRVRPYIKDDGSWQIMSEGHVLILLRVHKRCRDLDKIMISPCVALYYFCFMNSHQHAEIVLVMYI